jgi:hypothetical protein
MDQDNPLDFRYQAINPPRKDTGVPQVPIYAKCPVLSDGRLSAQCYCSGACRRITGWRDATPEEQLPPSVRY